MTEKTSFLERRLAGEQQTLAQPLATLVRRAPVVCRVNESVRDAVTIMSREGVGSVVVVDEAGRPVGVFTTADLVGVVATGREWGPVADAMTKPPVGLPGHAMAYEAALAMTSMGIRHILVMEDDRLAGVVSERDLFSLQRLGLGEITTEIRLATRPELLVEIAAEIRKLARMLSGEGVAAEHLTMFVSVLNDRLCQRILEIERKNHALERVSWCWLAFGSEGRLEQTFATDQDNGLIFSSHGEATPDAARAALLPFARRVNEVLDACGFPLCRGNVMASNPRFCLSAEEWRSRIRGWIEVPEPKALLDAAICFDFRALHGDATLAVLLREWIHPLVRANPAFLRLMAENALQCRPPLGWLRDFATEDAPGHPHSLNLKMNGARPFVDAARIYALANGLAFTNTGQRLRAVRERIRMGAAENEALVQGFFVIQGLRLRNQARLAPGDEGANRADPLAMNELERTVLKAAFQQARDLQARLALDYRV